MAYSCAQIKAPAMAKFAPQTHILHCALAIHRGVVKCSSNELLPVIIMMCLGWHAGVSPQHHNAHVHTTAQQLNSPAQAHATSNSSAVQQPPRQQVFAHDVAFEAMAGLKSVSQQCAPWSDVQAAVYTAICLHFRQGVVCPCQVCELDCGCVGNM